MKNLFERLRTNRNNKGMTFVEIICAVAILSLVSSVISGVITVGTNTYRKGVSETNIQQEAQLAANNISNIVKDAYAVVYADANGGTYYENGSPVYGSDGNVTTRNDVYTELSLLTNGYMQYTVLHDTTTGELWYGEIDLTNISGTYTFTPGSDMELMASNITDFFADTTDFETNRTITLTMTVKDESTGREIPMTYTMKSRNESGAGVAYTAVTVSEAIYVDNKVVLVPGEEYEIPIVLYGTTQTPTYSVTSTDLSVKSISTEGVTVKVAGDPSVDTVYLYLYTEDGTSTVCEIDIRRVKGVQVGYKVSTTSTEDAGAAYTFTAVVSGNQLTKWIGYDCDTDYKTAQAVTWSWELTAGGETKTGNTGETWENDYLELGSYTEDEVYPQLVMTLKQDMPSDFSLTVRATSKHAKGIDKDGNKTNKAGFDYYVDEYGECTVDKSENEPITVSGEWKRGGTVSLQYNLDDYLITWADGTVALDYSPNTIVTTLKTLSMYNNSSTGNNVSDTSTYSFSTPGNSIGDNHSLVVLEGDTSDITSYTASIATTSESSDGRNWIELSSYSSPYTTADQWGWWLDLHEIYILSYIGGETNPLAVVEETYEIEDVVFQYTNALPNTIAGGGRDGDSDGEWTDKDGDNTLVVYVTPDDTIGSYISYYKLSEGWEETYEAYTLLPERYVGVIERNSAAGANDGERFYDFSVTNTTGDGTSNTLGRSYVTFTFSNVSSYVGKKVQMIYEFNPFFMDASTGYGEWRNVTLEQAEAIDGCEGILEFHFVNANITEKNGVTMPEVRYCPTYSENSSSATPNYYYISTTSRFKINSDGTAVYQTTTDPTTGSWSDVCNMTYSSSTGKWTIN